MPQPLEMLLQDWIAAVQGLAVEALILHRDVRCLDGVVSLSEREDCIERRLVLGYIESSLCGPKGRCDKLAEKMAQWERDAGRP